MIPEMKKMLAEIEAISAEMREMFALDRGPYVIEGDSSWVKRIPRTENRVADLAGFLRWAASEGISDGDINRVIGKAFADLSLTEVGQARQLA